MKYILPVILTICCVATVANSQVDRRKAHNKCKIEIQDAPKLRGYFLGQELSDVSSKARSERAVYEGMPATESSVFIRGVMDLTKATESDSAYSVDWMFLENKVVVLRMQYIGYTPRDLSDFILNLTRSFKLPESIFESTSEYKAQAKCEGFSIYLTTAYKIDERTRQFAQIEIVERKAEKAYDRRREFEKKMNEATTKQNALPGSPRKNPR